MNPNEWYERQQKFGKAMRKLEKWKKEHCEIKDCYEIAVIELTDIAPMKMLLRFSDSKRLCHKHLKLEMMRFYNLKEIKKRA